ncbi:hypothetical protein D3C87_2102420 [compost metagenome]
MIGKIRYTPDEEMVRPAEIEPKRMPTVNVIIIRPASVGVSPFTSCRYMGSIAMAPNMPMPMMKFNSDDRPNVMFLNKRNGISA